jgi:hypothetical protein
MSDHQIQFVNKVPRQDIHSAINAVGGRNADGSIWRLSLANAVGSIQANKYRFFVAAGARSVWVVVARSSAGHLYLKTEADSLLVDNLLSLPEFP